jgi:putative transposase
VRRYEPPEGWVAQAYRFALEPTPAQDESLLRHCGAARFVFNHMLARISAVGAQREAEATYGLDEDGLTPWQGWSLPALRRTCNQAKPTVASWWGEVSKEAFNTGLDALSRALGNWQSSRQGQRPGRRVGFPQFKSRDRARMSVRFTTGAIRVEPDRRHVVLPRLAGIRTAESTRKLTRRVEAGTARILSATVTRTGGRWLCSLQVEVRRDVGRPAHVPRVGATLGVDAGVKHLAVLSTGEQVPNPAPLGKALKRLAKAQRSAAGRIGPYDTTTRRRRDPSKRWRRTQQRVGKLHALVAAARADAWHQLTTRLAQRFDRIVVEDLNVAGMVRNRRLARAISDASPAMLRRHLTYKTTWYGSALHVAGRWYPSSKTCSACLAVKPKLSLSERVFACQSCGIVLDRDLNAARNLATLARHVDLELPGDAKTGRGACRRPTPSGGAAGREASRPPHAVNVARQRTTADHELTKVH